MGICAHVVDVNGRSGSGGEILMSIFQQLADVYMTLATRRDINEQIPLAVDKISDNE